MTQPYFPQQQQMQQPQYQQPAMPQYPQQPMQQYPPQQQFVYPQQMQQQPMQPLVQGTFNDFFNQPSTGGGPVFSWKGKPIGTTYVGIVSRPIMQSDIQQQTMPGSNVPAYFRDGRPKFLMKIPLQVHQSPEFPDGTAQWWVSGSARDELARAMTEAGCEPNTTPEVGAAIAITLTGERPSGPGMNPSKTYHVKYQRPNSGSPNAQPAVPQGTFVVQPQQQVMQPQPQQQQVMQQPQPMPVPPNQTVSVNTQPQPQQQVMAQPQQVQQPVTQNAPPMQSSANDLSPEQQQLLASLTGG